MGLEFLLVALARTQVEGDAVVGARHDQRRMPGGRAHRRGAAHAVGQQDRVALARLDGVDLRLERGTQVLRYIVQPLAI